MELLYDYLFFLAKTTTFVISFLVTLLIAVAIVSKAKGSKSKLKLKVSKLNDKFDEMVKVLDSKTLNKKELKLKHKEKSKQDKKKTEVKKDRVFLIDFKGDMKASAVDQLRDQVTATLQVATPKDEVVVTIESPGGVVHGYGLAASQLVRIREQKIPLTVCVDKVAASGGYLMATVADQILAAPFAIIGSIGVVAQLPNFNKLLKKNNIDFEEHTAGDFKRTLSYFGEITDSGREKFQETLIEVHDLFKAHISKYRPNVNIENVANGDHWLGTTAHSMQLVDRIMTSDDYLLKQHKSANIYQIESSGKKSIVEKLTGNIHAFASYFNIHL